ncbi:hypothetical protein F4778DRAFT_154983 [Xylariomycetidae sp. FL2044]|nr:hypothetical protein F4778DRAFT_154983 [Xylariomycetidae sp. FL2044]
MSQMHSRGSSGVDAKTRRRRIRKGTHSCWECRRRKIRCLLADNATVCAGCESRGTPCVSQEFDDNGPSAPDRRLAQRLGRVEHLLERLVGPVGPDFHASIPERGLHEVTNSAEGDHDSSDVLRPPVTESMPLEDLLTSMGGDFRAVHLVEPHREQSTATRGEENQANKYSQTSRTLHSLFPCQQDIDAITSASHGPLFVLMVFCNYQDLLEGRSEPVSSVSEVPPVTSHPALLAKRLIQLSICLQQLAPSAYPTLVSPDSVRSMVKRFVHTVSELVISNDELVCSVEGLEAMSLVAVSHANAGNLRKAWLLHRRSLAIAQLMGVDRRGMAPLKSVDPSSEPSRRTKAHMLWARMNFSDRYLSLILGLPACNEDHSFTAPEFMVGDSDLERMEKLHAVVMSSIINRNRNKSDTAFGVTQEIDCELERIAKSMGPNFWEVQVLTEPSSHSVCLIKLMRTLLQMHHHGLIILLHLPYMMRDPKERRWDYSKSMCMNSSRRLLEAFIVFMRLNDAAFACRHKDYGALAAALTLLLGYLDPRLRARDEHTSLQREADRKLVKEAKTVMQEMARANSDKLASETSDIINRLTPIFEVNATSQDMMSGSDSTVLLDIPYLGSITINPVRRLSTTLPVPETLPPAPVNTMPIVDDIAGSGFATNDIDMSYMPGFDMSYSRPDIFPSLYDPGRFDNTQYESQFQYPTSQELYADPTPDSSEWGFQGIDVAFFETLLNNDLR